MCLTLLSVLWNEELSTEINFYVGKESELVHSKWRKVIQMKLLWLNSWSSSCAAIKKSNSLVWKGIWQAKYKRHVNVNVLRNESPWKWKCFQPKATCAKSSNCWRYARQAFKILLLPQARFDWIWVYLKTISMKLFSVPWLVLMLLVWTVIRSKS